MNQYPRIFLIKRKRLLAHKIFLILVYLQMRNFIYHKISKEMSPAFKIIQFGYNCRELKMFITLAISVFIYKKEYKYKYFKISNRKIM